MLMSQAKFELGCTYMCDCYWVCCLHAMHVIPQARSQAQQAELERAQAELAEAKARQKDLESRNLVLESLSNLGREGAASASQSVSVMLQQCCTTTLCVPGVTSRQHVHGTSHTIRSQNWHAVLLNVLLTTL